MKRYGRIIAASLAMSFIMLAGCEQNGGEGGEGGEEEMMMEEESVISVQTAYPAVRTISQPGIYIGTIESGEKISVTPRVGGYVKTKYFGLGDFVNAGDVLFTIDDTDLLLAKKKAEADVKDANASLAKDKADNEATKFDVNETLNTLDTKTQENYNNIQKALRTEYEAQLDLYKACESESKHKKEGEYLEDLIKKDKDAIDNARDFTKNLKTYKSAYDRILLSIDWDAAKALAMTDYGVAESDINAAPHTVKDVGIVYLKKKAMYPSVDDLEKAISASEEAEQTAKTAKGTHESSDRSNDLDIVSDQVTAQKERGNIATAQEDTALKRKIAADYEIFTKAKLWAQQQAKLASGDASVLSSSVKLSKAQIDLEIADRKLKDTNVTSPVSGEIVECKVEDFGTVTDSAPVYTIIDTSRKKAVFYVTGDAKNNMAVGQTVKIEKNGQEYDATVDKIADTPDEKKLLYKVSAILSEGDKTLFDAGTSIRLITSIKTSSNALTVPIGVVYYDEGRAFVYVAKGDTARKIPIETGVDDETDIEVVSGLSADDQVIVNWSEQLQDNAKINITQAADKIVVNTPEPNVKTEDTSDGKEEPKAEEPAPKAEEPEKNTTKEVEATSNVNIRKDPTTDSERLSTVKAGDRFVKIGDEAGGWTKIIYNDSEAYVKSDYVRECE